MKPSIHSKYSNDNPPYLDDKWEYFPSYDSRYLLNKFRELIKNSYFKN